MNELKLLLNLLKSNYKKIWKIFFFIIIFSLLANFFTITQPLIFASMLEMVIPENFRLFENTKISEVSKNDSIFNLDNIGSYINHFIQNNFLNSELKLIDNLILLSTVFLIFAIISALLNYTVTILSKWANFTFAILIRKDFIKCLLKLDYIFFLKSKYSEIVSRILVDAKNISQGLVPFLQSFFHNGTLVIAYSFFLFSTDYFLFFLSLLIFFIQYVIIIITKSRIRLSQIKLNNIAADLLNELNELFSSIRIVKIFNNEKFQFKKVNKTLNEERQAGLIASLFDKMQIPISSILTSISSILILFAILFKIQNGELGLQGGVLFLVMGRLMIDPIVKLSVMFTWLIAFSASFHKIEHYKKLIPIIKNGEIVKDKFNFEIRYLNSKFSYYSNDNKKNLVFGDVSIKKNEKIALVGESGSGKSTFADTLLRLHDLTDGEIRIDGINIKNLKVDSYRSLFGFIPQEPVLFNDTIFENIRCGRKEITDPQVMEAARLANAENFILNKENKYNTLIGDRGSSLSGGEKQRISIARALANKPEILVFDEATSALDVKTEKELLKDLNLIFLDRTVIIISHKFNIVKNFDKILFFNNGVIENLGNHEELMKKSSSYKNFYKLGSIS